MARIESGLEFDKDKNHAKLSKTLDNDVKPYLLNIPASLYKKIKRKLVEDDNNLRAVILEYLYKYIDE